MEVISIERLMKSAGIDEKPFFSAWKTLRPGTLSGKYFR